MKIRLIKTYAGTWIDIDEGFVKDDFIIDVSNGPSKKAYRDTYDKEFRTYAQATVSMKLKSDKLEMLEDAGKVSNDFRYLVDGFKSSGHGGRPTDAMVRTKFEHVDISYKGMKKEESKIERWKESIDTLRDKFKPERLIREMLKDVNERMTTAVERTNSQVLNDNLGRTQDQHWKTYVDEKLGIESINDEIAALEAKLESVKKRQLSKRNAGMLGLFEGELDWGVKDEDLGMVKLPEPIVEAFKENLKNNKGFGSLSRFSL